MVRSFTIGHQHDDIIFTTTTRILQGFVFFLQIKAFAITKFKYERKNEKDSGRSSKMTPSCKWPIFSLTSASPPLTKKDVYLPRLFPTVFTRSLYIATVWHYKCKTVCSLCGWFFPSKKQRGLGQSHDAVVNNSQYEIGRFLSQDCT